MNLHLISSEYEYLKGPFSCTIMDNRIINKKQVLIVSIKPLLEYEIGVRAVNTLLLIAKYNGKRIRKLDKFPIDVIVFVPDDEKHPDTINRKWSEMNSIGWAQLVDDK